MTETEKRANFNLEHLPEALREAVSGEAVANPEPTTCPDCGAEDCGVGRVERGGMAEVVALLNCQARQLAQRTAERDEALARATKAEAQVERLKAVYCEVHCDDAPAGPCPCCAAVEIERLRERIGVCDKCGELLTVQDSMCWPCHEAAAAAKEPQ